MTTDTFATLPLTSIVSSPTNPRKTFNAAKLAELAESIKASGLHQPILVRPLPGDRVADTARGTTHEIVAGERRWRASQIAGMAAIPAMVRTLTDNQVLEIQLIENLQRDDLTELEEAEGYEALMAASHITAEAVGSKIGKSRSYVYGRIKLLDLSVECKQAMRDGQLDASRAILIARIPDTALQTKALVEATRKDYAGQVCSVRALNSWLQANVMLRLDRATFNPADSALVVSAGNCTTCPKRTGANPDLFADVPCADICTDPECFHGKEAAHRASVLDTAAKRGMRLIDGDEADEICHQYTASLDGYSPLTQERTDTTDGQPATLGQLLGKDLSSAVLIENPYTKELIAAIPTDEAEAMLLARGLVKVAQAKQKAANDIEADIKRLQSKAENSTSKLFRQMAFDQLASKVHSTDDQHAHKLLCPLLLRAWWLRQVDDLENEDLAAMFGITLLNPSGNTELALHDAQNTQVRLHVQACSQAKLYKAMVLYMVLEDNPGYFYSNIAEPTLYTALASEMGVDLEDIEAQATAQVRNETADELKKLKAQLKAPLKGTDITATGYRGPNGETWSGRGLMPRWLAVLVRDGQDKEAYRITPTPDKSPKALVPLAPAAQAKGVRGAGPKGQGDKAPAAPSGDAPLRKRKMSAADAQAAIASAMQDQDTDSGADAQGNVVDSSQPVAADVADAPKASLAVDAFEVGQKVCVTTDDNKLGKIARKWSGKRGTVTRREPGGGYWDVTFRGRNGGVALFAEDQIESVGA